LAYATVGNIVSQPSVTLGTKAVVNGSVQTGGILVNLGATVTGAITTDSAVATDASIQATVNFPALAPPVAVLSGATTQLAPGAYGSVIVNPGATLSLSTGTYEVASLNVLTQATLQLNESAGPVLIYIQSGFQFAGIENQQGGDGNVLVGVFGLGDAALLTAPFRGTISAQNGEIELGTVSGGFAGAYFASNVQVDVNTTVTGIGAVTPPGTGGLAPTLNCITQFDSTHLGALFGYTNSTGASVTLGVGPHNFVSPAPTDRQQPILFLPGPNPVATFVAFAPGTHVTLTIGQQAAIASSSSPSCPASLAAGLESLSTPTPTSQALFQSMMGILSNPHMPQLIADIKTAFGGQFSPFQTSLLNAVTLIINNVDLLTTPSSAFTAAQSARAPAFVNGIQTNPAVLAMRLQGDATRGVIGDLQCDVLATDNGRPLFTLSPPPTDSILGQTIAMSLSSGYVNTTNAIASVAASAQEAVALQAMPGLALVLSLPPSVISGLSLPGLIPTSGSVGQTVAGIGDWLIGAGTIVAGVVSVVGGCVGDVFVPGSCAVGIAGGVLALGTAANFFALGYQDITNSCNGAVALPTCELGIPISPVGCGTSGALCIGGCCVGEASAEAQQAFTAGLVCPGTSGIPCSTDGDCTEQLAGNCLNGCCNFAPLDLCGTATQCSGNSDCSGSETCQFGCCAGPCGINGQVCDNIVTASCGIETTCASGQNCTNGCCVGPAQPPPQ
jgi:hypothetical protein